ncbi:MAG: beta-lactamase family protein [Hyphomonadaceae bacterium]|nr:beta-lactamase family protein [Hyphomonadaceae bacterium]
MRSIAIWVIAVMLSACATAPAPRLPSGAAIDAEAQRLMADERVVGMAVAVIDDGRVVHVNAYGYANLAEQRPLQRDTIMYGASLTKVAFAYMVMQLVDEGRLDLDRSIADYLPRPLPAFEDYADLEGDERWRLITPRILLTHRSGFANMRVLEADHRLSFHFTPGERYAYSNEGIWVLQTVLEEGLGLDVGAEMQRRVFDRFAMTRTSMQWRADFRPNLADGYAMDGSFEPHDERSNVAAAGSMDTTIEDQARLWAGILSGEGLSAQSRAEFVRGQFAVSNARQFPTLSSQTDPRAGEIALSAAPGLMTFNDPRAGLTWFRGGHNDWTGNIAICQEQSRRCVVFLGNSVRAELIYEDLARFIIGETAMPWWWMYDN